MGFLPQKIDIKYKIYSIIEDIEEMYKNISVVGSLFEEIEKNLKFFVERRETHSKSKFPLLNKYLVIADILELIKKVTLIKIGSIVLIVIIQVLYVKKIFNHKGNKSEAGGYEMNPFNKDPQYGL